MLSPPSDMIGFYFSLAKIVKVYDPHADLVAQHDEKYDAMMTDLFMNSLSRVDVDITDAMTKILSLDKPSQRNLLVSLVKRFIHSLGFEFMNLRITLFVWDQIIMRVYPMGIEIFLVMAITFQYFKEDFMRINNWDQWVQFYYANCKMMDFDKFVGLYRNIFKDFNYYNSVYNDPELSQVEYSVQDGERELNRSLISDVSKKLPISQKKPPRTHTMLSQKSLKDDKKVNLSQVRVEDPELNYAISKNIKMGTDRQRENPGIIPVMDMDDDQDDGLFDDLGDDNDDY